MKKFITIIIFIIVIFFFTLDDENKKSLLFDKLGFERPLTWFYVGDMSSNKDRLIFDKKITVWGYLIKVHTKYMLIQDEDLVKIHFLKQPNLIILRNKDNKSLNNLIDDHCVGHYVEAQGKLNKFSGLYTLQFEIMFGMEKDFSFPCTPTYTNGKLNKPNFEGKEKSN